MSDPITTLVPPDLVETFKETISETLEAVKADFLQK